MMSLKVQEDNVLAMFSTRLNGRLMAPAHAKCWAPTCAMHRASWMSQMQKVASADMEARYLPLACRDRSVTASVCCVRVLCRGKPSWDA